MNNILRLTISKSVFKLVFLLLFGLAVLLVSRYVYFSFFHGLVMPDEYQGTIAEEMLIAKLNKSEVQVVEKLFPKGTHIGDAIDTLASHKFKVIDIRVNKEGQAEVIMHVWMPLTFTRSYTCRIILRAENDKIVNTEPIVYLRSMYI